MEKSKGTGAYVRITRTFFRDKTAVMGLGIVSVVIGLSLTAPWLSPYNPVEQRILSRFQGPSGQHILGTDEFGRDTLSRVLWGSRISLLIGISSVLVSMLCGVPIGIVAGYLGGKIDDVVTRIVDILMSFPTLLLGLMVLAVLGSGVTNTVIAIALALFPRFIRLARGPTIALREREFVEASKAIGQTEARIIFLHILPNILGPIIVMATLWMATAIRTEANLSFLGLGVKPPTPTWGNMIRAGVQYLTLSPWLAVFPGVALTLTILGCNMIGDGLRDALDPKLQR